MSERDEQQGSEDKNGRRLFSDISAVQVVATALASVTSMLLASYIGIAGSVIGVGVASVVSTVAASLYKKFLADSAEKIKELPDAVKSVAHHGQTEPSTDDEGAGKKPDSPDAKAATGAAAETEEQHLETPENHPATHHKKRLIIICVVSALIAVASTAIIVYVATTGQGLGAKPEPIIKTELEHVERTASPADDGSSSGSPEDNAQNADATNLVNATNEENAQNAQPENTETENTETENDQDQQTNQEEQTNTQPTNTSNQQPSQTNAQSAATETVSPT